MVIMASTVVADIQMGMQETTMVGVTITRHRPQLPVQPPPSLANSAERKVFPMPAFVFSAGGPLFPNAVLDATPNSRLE